MDGVAPSIGLMSLCRRNFGNIFFGGLSSMVAVCDAPFAKGRNEFDEEVGRSDCRLLPEGRACTGGHIALLYDQDETRGHRIATLSVTVRLSARLFLVYCRGMASCGLGFVRIVRRPQMGLCRWRAFQYFGASAGVSMNYGMAIEQSKGE